MNLLKNLYHKLWRNNPAKLSTGIILLWLFVALIAPILSNNKPVIEKNKDGISFPIFQNDYQSEINNNFAIHPLLPYKYSDINPRESLLPPFTKGEKGMHILGTDKIGRDVMAGMIHGARVAAIVIILSIGISFILGLIIGMTAGYYSDEGLRANALQYIIGVFFFISTVYYLVFILIDSISIYTLVPFFGSIALWYFLHHLANKLDIKKYGFPLDNITQRLFELKESMPGVFFILSAIAIFNSPSFVTIALIISFLLWITLARQFRAETYLAKEEDFVKSAKSTGMKDFQIMRHHILPNILPPILVVIAFSSSSVILLESTLSFLGIGIPLEEMSWGKILAEARKYHKAWWLAVFPGIAIFLVIYAFNTLGDYLSRRHKKIIQ